MFRKTETGSSYEPLTVEYWPYFSKEVFNHLKLFHQEERISLDAVINEIFKLADHYQYVVETEVNSKRLWDDFDRFYLNQVA